MTKKGDLIELEIERMSFGPAAIGRYFPDGEERGVVVFVSGAAPQDHVRAKLTHQHKNYWEAELVEILRASPDRVEPACPVFARLEPGKGLRQNSCGGCQWQHLSYAAQIRAKEEILLHQLSRSTRLPLEDLRRILRVHPAKNAYAYRSRLQVHGDQKGLGFYAPGTHRVVHTERCAVAHDDIQKVWSRFLKDRPLAELSRATGQFKVEWVRTETGQIKEALNRKHGAFGFTQVNPEQNEVLVNTVTEIARQAAGPKRMLFDLYGGSGNLSKKLAPEFGTVLCVDSFNEGKDPVDLKTLGGGFQLVRSDVEEFLRDQRWRDWNIEKIDCVIADPPRTGLRGTAGLIANLKAPRLILVSCDPSTLGRDLSLLSDLYQVNAVHLIDLFPQTYHMETVIDCSLSSLKH
ncbi:MAG: hypothetical protein AB1540_08795 [Bdellovibrionota bacterium]